MRKNAPSSDATVIAVMLNPKSGTLRNGDIESFSQLAKDVLGAKGQTVEVHVARGKEIMSALETLAQRKDVSTIVAGGGDGTISAAAGFAWQHGKILGVLPGGTMNLIARALGLPMDMTASLNLIASADVVASDIVTANGRPFLHQFSVGLQVRIVTDRDRMSYRTRVGKMLASTRALLQNVVRPPRFAAEVRCDGQVDEQNRFCFLAVSNNIYGADHLPFPDRLDGGKLGVYAAKPLGLISVLPAAHDVFFGRWQSSNLVSARTSQSSVQLRFAGSGRGARASVDGELIPLEQVVDIVLHPKALNILTPARDDGVKK